MELFEWEKRSYKISKYSKLYNVPAISSNDEIDRCKVLKWIQCVTTDNGNICPTPLIVTLLDFNLAKVPSGIPIHLKN